MVRLVHPIATRDSNMFNRRTVQDEVKTAFLKRKREEVAADELEAWMFVGPLDAFQINGGHIVPALCSGKSQVATTIPEIERFAAFRRNVPSNPGPFDVTVPNEIRLTSPRSGNRSAKGTDDGRHDAVSGLRQTKMDTCPILASSPGARSTPHRAKTPYGSM